MRLLLVLLALLSGLSLSEVTASAARAEVVGTASGAVLVARAEHQVSTGQVKARRPSGETRLAMSVPLPVPAFIRATSISIWDRPRE